MSWLIQRIGLIAVVLWAATGILESWHQHSGNSECPVCILRASGRRKSELGLVFEEPMALRVLGHRLTRCFDRFQRAYASQVVRLQLDAKAAELTDRPLRVTIPDVAAPLRSVEREAGRPRAPPSGDSSS